MQAQLQNAVAVLAVAVALLLLGWTAVAKNRPLIAKDHAAIYADAG